MISSIPILRAELHVSAETVEKPKKWNLKTSKCLILLYANTAKMQNLDFFDSLAMKMQISEVENICDIFEQGDFLKGFTLSFIIGISYLSSSWPQSR